MIRNTAAWMVGRGRRYFRNVTELVSLACAARTDDARSRRKAINDLTTLKREHSQCLDELYPITDVCSPGPMQHSLRAITRRDGKVGVTRARS